MAAALLGICSEIRCSTEPMPKLSRANFSLKGNAAVQTVIVVKDWRYKCNGKFGLLHRVVARVRGSMRPSVVLVR